MDPVQLATHVTELARRFGVLVFVHDGAPDDAAAGVHRSGKPMIRISPVIDETTYAAALHELGHCLHPTGMLQQEMSPSMRLTQKFSTLRDVRLKLTEEQSAWAWAEHYALEWTPLMASVKRMTLGTYERAARSLGVKP